jgi:hypothetical protein
MFFGFWFLCGDFDLQAFYHRPSDEELLAILVRSGPGGAGKLRRGEKTYLAKKSELTRQLEGMPRDMLAELATSWRARPSVEDDKKALIVKLLQQTP